MKLLLPLAAILVSASSAEGAVTVVKSSATPVMIPDNDTAGYSKTLTITAGEGGVPAAEEISSIIHVSVDLSFTGGWNGDLFVYLVHHSTLAVLLNRVGRDTLTPDGSSSSGILITLDDLATANVHDQAPASGIYTGTFSSDGRETDFDSVITSDPRTAMLSDFFGAAATGDWTLFVADVGFDQQSTLQNWTLTVTAVPEPAVPLLLNASACLALLLRRRRRLGGS